MSDSWIHVFSGFLTTQVSATFAASLVISPALGSILQQQYGSQAVFLVSSIIAVLDVLFIFFFVPEVSGVVPARREMPGPFFTATDHDCFVHF